MNKVLCYAISYSVVIGCTLVSNSIKRKKLKKEEKRDLSKKAEAYGWDIVECEYTIEAV